MISISTGTDLLDDDVLITIGDVAFTEAGGVLTTAGAGTLSLAAASRAAAS
jgi:hypothetical protein